MALRLELFLLIYLPHLTLRTTGYYLDCENVRTRGLALCFSAAEYSCPVLQHSIHANELDPVLNQTCRIITCCMRPTNVDSLYILAGITPPKIRRLITAQKERLQQTQDSRHMLNDHTKQQERQRAQSFYDV